MPPGACFFCVQGIFLSPRYVEVGCFLVWPPHMSSETWLCRICSRNSTKYYYVCAMCWNIKAHEGSAHCFAHAELWMESQGAMRRRNHMQKIYRILYIIHNLNNNVLSAVDFFLTTLSFHDPVNGVHMLFVPIHSDTHTPNSNTWRNTTIVRIRHLHGYDRRLCPTASLDTAPWHDNSVYDVILWVYTQLTHGSFCCDTTSSSAITPTTEDPKPLLEPNGCLPAVKIAKLIKNRHTQTNSRS